MVKFSIVQKLNNLLLKHVDNPLTLLDRVRITNLETIAKEIFNYKEFFFDKETEIGHEIIIENSINVISEEEIKSLKKLIHNLELNYDYVDSNSKILKQINEILNT